jgi:hypothetical protein
VFGVEREAVEDGENIFREEVHSSEPFELHRVEQIESAHFGRVLSVVTVHAAAIEIPPV